MSCIGLIREHIDALSKDCLFATRDLVQYGMRSAVDQATFKLVRAGLIVRLARGIFIKAEGIRPGFAEIAAYKARSFGRKIITLDADHAEEWQKSVCAKFKNSESARLKAFAPDFAYLMAGRSSSFKCLDKVIYLQGVSGRKTHNKKKEIGQKIRHLWHSGLGTRPWANKITSLTAEQNYELVQKAQWMPAWLSDELQSSAQLCAALSF